jgi:hypothetical protein
MTLIPLTNQEDLRLVLQLKGGLIEGSADFSETWMRTHEWRTIPLERSGLSADDARLLARALDSEGCRQVLAIATEEVLDGSSPTGHVAPGWPDPLGSSVEAFLVDATVDGLLEFSQACSSYNFVLVPTDRSVAVLCTVYDYYLIAGPLEFVQTAAGKDISSAWHEFEECAEQPVWKGRLKEVVSRYREFGPSQSGAAFH